MHDRTVHNRSRTPKSTFLLCSAHPGERDAAVTAAGALGGLLVEVRHKLASGRLHHLRLVRLGVVGMTPSVGYAPVAANHLGGHTSLSLSSHVIVGGKEW